MKDQRRIGAHRDKGFTLVELSVALSVALIITGLAYETYLLTSRIVNRWEHGMTVSNAAHRIARQVIDDVRRARDISARPREKTLALVMAPRDTVRYQWTESIVRRDGQPMHTRTVGAEGVVVHVEPFGRRLQLHIVIRLIGRPQKEPDETAARRMVVPTDTIALSLRAMTRRSVPWPVVSL